MNLKERVNRNPYVFLLAVAMTGASMAGGIVEYFCKQRIALVSQKSDLEVGRLQGELSSLKRGLGESKYLDVRSFVFPKERRSHVQLNPRSRYFATEGFYALTNMPGWSYEQTTGEGLSEREYGEHLPPELAKIVGDAPIHLWRALEHRTVRGPGDYVESGPLIILQRTPIEKVLKITGERLPEIIEQETGEKVTAEEMKDPLKEMERIFRGDAAAALLPNILTVPLAEMLGSPQTSSEVVELQKVGNVVYVQFLTTLHDTIVDGKRQTEFFVRHEAIIVSDRDTVTVIHVIVPTSDPAPRGLVYAQTQEWFSGLAILVQ